VVRHTPDIFGPDLRHRAKPAWWREIGSVKVPHMVIAGLADGLRGSIPRPLENCQRAKRAHLTPGPRHRAKAYTWLCAAFSRQFTHRPDPARATLRQSINDFSWNGLLRKHTAPAVMARVRNLSSGKAVMKIMGVG
jgi:hypothetical protein